MESKLGYLCGSNSWGGLEMNQLRNAIWMKQKGYQVTLFCWKNSPIHLNALQMDIDISIIEHHNKYYQFAKAFKLKNIIVKKGITHLILRSNHDISICTTLKWISGKKLHLSFFMEMQFGIRKTSIFHRIRYHYIDIWSCPLNWLKEQVEEKSTIHKSKLCVIPSGIELEKFSIETSQNKIREELKLPLEEKIIGIIGRIDKNKGHDIIIEAIKKCPYKSFKLLIIGEPTINENQDYLNYILDKIKNEDLNDRIIFRPFSKEIEKYYHAIDVLINATKSETVGMTTIEALASGTPVIGSNSGGTKEILSKNKIGYLFEPQNINDLSSKIELYLSKNEIFNSQTIKEAVEKFDHRKVCNLTEQILQLKKSF